MAENFYTMLTIVGKNKLSSSAVSGNKVNFKTLKVGDGKGAYYEPSENQTSLMNQVWEGNISSISIDENNSNWIVVETVIPASDGGFFIREAGIFDEDGDMIAISKLAETYKPVVAEGSTKDLVIRIVLEVLNVDTVTIKIDPNVVAATKNDVQVLEAKVQDVNAQLSDLVKSISNDAVLTQSIDFGMNSVIKNNNETSIQPEFTIQGKTLINLLGKDGNCEDVSKWGGTGGTLVLDSANKVFGSNSIKLTTMTTTNNYIRKNVSVPIDNTKYYCLSAYLKTTSASNLVYIRSVTASVKYSNAIASNAFTRTFVKLSPTDLTGYASIGIDVIMLTSTIGDTFNCDGLMLEEITQAQYNDHSFQPSPYVDSYVCLTNPYIEIRHDNLIRNGNGEEGIAWWNTSGTPTFNLSDDGYFVITDDDTNISEGVYQRLTLKPNTTYTLSLVAKCGTIPTVLASLKPWDNYGNVIDASRVNVSTSSTTDTMLTATITMPSNSSSLDIVLNNGTSQASNVSYAGTSYFKEIMLIEETELPIEYKSCSIERVVLETKLTSDDSIIYENGEVTGLINWKHKTLYGKDYDWQYASDYTGYKGIKVIDTLINGIQDFIISAGLSKLIKYDGKICSEGLTSANGADYFVDSSDGNFYLNISDFDTGWLETQNPNADEVKVFMNGWKAICYRSDIGRYTFWRSIVDGSLPPNLISTTVGATYTNGATSLTLTDASKFVNGQFIVVVRDDGQYQFSHILSITGNVITFSASLGGNCSIGNMVYKCDDGASDIPILNYCKNNIVNGYDGYQLHYKLQKPEPIDNCHAHGDIPKFDVGDNYLFLDSGGVLGEVANPIVSTYAVINGSQYTPTLKNKTEIINTIYKNLVYNNSVWTFDNTLAWGNQRLTMLVSSGNYDTNATYTVDYKILTTQAPQIGTIGCSYSQDISTAINNLQEEINNRQEHDSILDEIVDISLYENIQTNIPWTWIISGGMLYFNAVIFFSRKKVIPKITLPKIAVFIDSLEITNKSIVYASSIGIDKLVIHGSCSDALAISSIINKGVYSNGIYSIIADCQDRI